MSLLRPYLNRGFLGQAALAPVIVVVLLGDRLVAFGAGTATYTFGDRALDPDLRMVAILYAVGWILLALAFEAGARGALLERLRARMPTGRAVALHLAVVALVLAVPVAVVGSRTGELGLVRFAIHELSLQVLWTAVYLASGSILVGGALSGYAAILRFEVLNDVAGPFETLFFFASSTPAFYWSVLVPPLVAIGLVAAVARLVGSADTRPRET